MNKEDHILKKKYKSFLKNPTGQAFKGIKADTYSVAEESEDRPTVRVKFSGFGNIDDDRDILVKGCMSKSIQEHGAESSSNRKIAFLWQHDMRDPIGKSLKEEELDDGAYGTVKMSSFKAVPNSYRAFTQMQEGVLNQFSIGFFYDWNKMEYDETKDAFVIYEIKIYEYSVVTAGANEETQYDGIYDSSEDMKNYIKVMKELQPEKYELLKQFIAESEKAEPGKPLTSNWVLGAFAEKIIQQN